MKKITYLTIILIIIVISCNIQNDQKYLGQVTPDSNPTIFAPSFVSTGLYERDFAISPDGKEYYFSILMGDWNTIMFSKEVNGNWTEPAVPSFARDTNYFFLEPALSADGKKIFFLSTKPRATEQPKPGWANQNIWVAERTESGDWGEPKPLPENINILEEFYPSLTNDGSLYFCRTDNESEISAIYRSKLMDGIYQDPIKLPYPVNGKGTIFNAWISYDETFLIGCVAGRDSLKPANVAQYFLFFRNQDDTWSEGINLNSKLNLPCPNAISVSVSPDSKYLFFASTNKTVRFKDVEPSWSLSNLSKRRIISGNGNSDIYWMRFDDKIRLLKVSN